MILDIETNNNDDDDDDDDDDGDDDDDNDNSLFTIIPHGDSSFVKTYCYFKMTLGIIKE